VIHWIDGDDAPLPVPGSVDESELPGLVAAGGRLTLARLEQAYRQGLFPWYGPGQPVLWWSPDPRMVLEVDRFRLSRSLRRTLRDFVRTPGCEVRIDHRFAAVMKACATTPRDGQQGTWIVPAMVAAYTEWHAAGRTHSVETWVDGTLVGGLYFVSIGRMVFGESMFAHRTDASKIALAALVAACRAHGVGLVDCQQHTGHLESFGAHEIGRADFLTRLAPALGAAGASPAIDWTYDPAHWARLDPRILGPEERPT
jgi:leucyl/phenylalanyl-tRNA--protein transferase